jgi:hypothetical protein
MYAHMMMTTDYSTILACSRALADWRVILIDSTQRSPNTELLRLRTALAVRGEFGE